MFSEIERQGHQVTKVGNPISIDMKTRYVVKGVNSEKIINSVVNIFTNDKGKITKVEDKWDGSLPDGSVKNVSLRPWNPWAWLEFYGNIGFWAFSFFWYTWPWMVRTTRSCIMFDFHGRLSFANNWILAGFPPPQRQLCPAYG